MFKLKTNKNDIVEFSLIWDNRTNPESNYWIDYYKNNLSTKEVLDYKKEQRFT